MEHRWGERVAVNIPIRLTARPFLVRSGRLIDLSVSGALIVVACDLRVLSRIQVVIDDPQRLRQPTPVVSAYVARKSGDGFGIEWCEFAPRAVVQLIRASPRRYGLDHTVETPPIISPAELPVSVLKLGT
jgi:hypothetical protein